MLASSTRAWKGNLGWRGWVAHREGRHSGFSGWPFLEALCHEEGVEACSVLSGKWEKHFATISRGSTASPTDLSSEDAMEIVSSADGSFMLARRLSRKKTGDQATSCYARAYNAQDVGRVLLLCFCSSGLISSVDLTVGLFSCSAVRQSHWHEYRGLCGVRDLGSFLAFQDELARAAP